MNYRKDSKKISDWIGDVLENSGLQKIVIGMSGGVDSSLSATLAVRAVGKERIVPVLLPYGDVNSESVSDAELVIDFLQIPHEQVVKIDIQPGVDTLFENFERNNEGLTPVRRGNVMARVRMIALFDTAKKCNGLVCGTENKSEHYLGYYTRFGDEASDMEPIRSLYKTQVWEMAKILQIPKKIIIKAPTAGLWEGQTDENDLGFSYKDADMVLHYLIEEKLSEKEIIAKGLSEDLVQKVVQRVKSVEFKHTLPFVYK